MCVFVSSSRSLAPKTADHLARMQATRRIELSAELVAAVDTAPFLRALNEPSCRGVLSLVDSQVGSSTLLYISLNCGSE